MRFLTLFCIALVLAFSSCFERIDGCIDVEAVNFNAEADDNCCCEYPTLRFSVQHRMDSLVWQRDSVYETVGGQAFRLRDVAFYLSEFRLTQSGTPINIEDSQRFDVFSPDRTDTLSSILTDDFVLLRRTTVNFGVGTFRNTGNFDPVDLRLGLSDEANRVIPSLAPSGHPLRVQGDSLWLNPQDGFVPAYLVLERDPLGTPVLDTLRFTRTELADVPLQFGGAFFHETGFDFNMTVRIDYVKLFDNVDLSDPDINNIRSGIAANIPAIFSVFQ